MSIAYNLCQISDDDEDDDGGLRKRFKLEQITSSNTHTVYFRHKASELNQLFQNSSESKFLSVFGFGVSIKSYLKKKAQKEIA